MAFNKCAIKAVVFDMDGVLLDTETISFKTWEIAAKEFGVSDIQKAEHACMGANLADTITILNQLYENTFDATAFLDRTRTLFGEIENKDGISLMPYAKEVLCYLKGKYILALASSTRAVTVKRQLAKAHLIDYFDHFIYGDSVTHSKPDKQIYKTICQMMNIAPQSCVAIEDSPNGIKSANAANLHTIMIPDRIKPTEKIIPLCDHIFTSLNDLKTVL